MLLRSMSLVRHYKFRGVARPYLMGVVAAIVTIIGDSFALGAEPRTLTNTWSISLADSSEACPAIGNDGTIYFGTRKGDFVAFRPDGTRRWVFHGGREIHSSPAIGSDNTIYFGGRDRKLYALRADGTKKW